MTFQTEGHFFKVIFKRDLLYCDKSDIADVVNVVIDVVKENQAAAKQTFEVCSHFAGKPLFAGFTPKFIYKLS